MKKIKPLIYLILFFSSNIFCAQSNEKYTVILGEKKITQDIELVDDKEVNNNKTQKSEKFIFVYNLKKDSLLYFKNINESISNPITYALVKIKDTILLKEFNNQKKVQKLSIIFKNDSHKIKINNTDFFLLNKDYYNYLYKNVYENLNLLDLIDFLEDHLTDYNIKDLEFMISYEKYKHSNFIILDTYQESHRSQAEHYIDKWNIKYVYNKKGVLINLIKKSSEEDISFIKNLTSYKKGVFVYSSEENVESRLITKIKKTFNPFNYNYKEEINSIQLNRNRESYYVIHFTLLKKTPINKFYISTNDIKQILKK